MAGKIEKKIKGVPENIASNQYVIVLCMKLEMFFYFRAAFNKHILLPGNCM